MNAESIFEWRVRPGRLDDELAEFIADVYAAEPAESAAAAVRLIRLRSLEAG